MADYERFEEIRDKIRADRHDLRAWRELATMVSTPEDFDSVVFIINRISLRNKLRLIGATMFLLLGFAVCGLGLSAPENAREAFSDVAGSLSCLFFPMIIVYTFFAAGLFPTEVEICNDVLRSKTTKVVYEQALEYAILFRRGTTIQLAFESAIILLIWSSLCGVSYLPSESIESPISGFICIILFCFLPFVGLYFILRGYQSGIYKKPAPKPELIPDHLRIPFRVTRSGEIIELPTSTKKLP